VDQAGDRINHDMAAHSKEPLVSLGHLVHLRSRSRFLFLLELVISRIYPLAVGHLDPLVPA
jgi:hypothetical protein